MNAEELRAAYAVIHAQSDRLAGGLLDIPRRALILQSLYHETGGNHVFPMIAAHGALWGYKYFEIGGRVGGWISWRYFYNSQERAFRLGLLNRFAEGFRKVNRTVCVDTFANYQFVRQFGAEPDAGEVIEPQLLDGLRRVCAAAAASRPLTEAERQDVFERSFRFEQEVTVAPGVRDTIAQFDCPIMKALLTKPVVRFAFFPWWRYMWFHNFADQHERISKGFAAFAVAQRLGWEHVHRTLRTYQLLPDAYFQNPSDYSQAFRQQLLAAAAT